MESRQHTSDPRENPYTGDLADIWQNLRIMVRGTYDLQKLRISTGNRIAANFRSKLGIHSNEPEEKLSEEDKQIMKKLRESYKRLTDGLVKLPRENTFKGDEVISNFTELVLVNEYMMLLKREEEQFSRFKAFVSRFPIYPYLESINGCGPAMAGVLICEIDIRKAKYPSSLWALAGLDVAGDGQGRSRRKDHLVQRTYRDKSGQEKMKDSITFNPFLKTKLMGVLGPCLLKAVEERLTSEQKAAGMKARKGKYGRIYDDYKHRIETDPVKVANLMQRRAVTFKKELADIKEEEVKGHIHNMAVRYMIKQFLVDLYSHWRTLEGLPASPTYHEAKHGHVHRASA